VASVVFCFFDDLADHCSRDSVCFCNLSERETTRTVAQDSSPIEVKWTSSNLAAFEFCTSHSCSNSFNNEIAFQFCVLQFFAIR